MVRLKSWLLKIWKKARNKQFPPSFRFPVFNFIFTDKNPSLTILSGLLCGILPSILLYSYPLYKTTAFSLSLAVIISFFANWQTVKKIVFWCIIGIVVTFLYNNYPSNSYSLLLPRNCNAQIKAITIDPELTGNNVSWLQQPEYIKVRVEAFRYSYAEAWTKASGLVNVQFLSKKRPVSYGELLELDGSFMQPQDALFHGSFDYRSYLKSQGISKIFVCSSYKKLGQAGFPYNVYRKIYNVRNFVLHCLCSGFKSGKIKGFLAGFFFGCRQGISRQMKQIFLRSGTIHILAISGLHVGILALILLLICRFLPITPRYIIVPALLFFYVFLTGFRPSGLRALIMISIFCFHKAFFYSIRPINSVAFAAVLILLINPFAIENTGFQFSFIIVSFLILAWEKTNNISNAIEEINRWKISDNFGFLKRFGFVFHRKLVLLVMTSIVAGLAGTGLILYYQSLFIPSMVLLNILILPLLLPLFFLGSIKILAYLLSTTMVPALNFLLNSLVSLIIYIANWGACSGFTRYYHQPSIIFLIVFYILLVGVLALHSKKKVLIFISSISVMLIFWLSSSIFGSGNITVIQGVGDIPTAIIIEPNAHNNPILINCPQKLGSVVANKLKQDGVNELEGIVISKMSKKYAGGVPWLLSLVHVKNIIFTHKIPKTKLYKKIIRECKEYGVNIITMPLSTRNIASLNIKQTFIGNCNNIAWNISGKQIGIIMRTIHPGLKKLIIKVNNRQKAAINIQNSNTIQIFSVRESI